MNNLQKNSIATDRRKVVNKILGINYFRTTTRNLYENFRLLWSLLSESISGCLLRMWWFSARDSPSSCYEISWLPSDRQLSAMWSSKRFFYSLYPQSNIVRNQQQIHQSRSWQRTISCSCHSNRSRRRPVKKGSSDHTVLRRICQCRRWKKFLES